jgi:hypothetical protein
MDLDDLLEDLLDDLGLDDLGEDLRAGLRGRRRDVRRRVDERATQARRAVREGRRLPGLRARLRTAALYGSIAWGTVVTGGAVALSTVGVGFNGWDVAAIGLGTTVLPAVGVGTWAWRTRARDTAQRHQGQARRAAREERTVLPADVAGDWNRLRQAQALVEDLAGDGLVDPAAVAELGSTAEQLRVLLVADRRASQLGGSPSAPLRTQVADLADLLVALAVEAVDSRTEEVGPAATPVTLREATDRLASLRAARAEVEATDAAVRDPRLPGRGEQDDGRQQPRPG